MHHAHDLAIAGERGRFKEKREPHLTLPLLKFGWPGADSPDVRLSSRTTALALLAVLGVGCMTVPARYRQPERVYQPGVERVGVTSLSKAEYEAIDGRSLSDESAMKWLLEDTRCARQVGGATDGRGVHVEVESVGTRHYGVGRTVVRLVEACTVILPYIGLPFPGAADGEATARLYRDGALVKELKATSRVGYWTWIYVYMRADRKGIGTARWMALRDLSDQVAAELCASPIRRTSR